MQGSRNNGQRGPWSSLASVITVLFVVCSGEVFGRSALPSNPTSGGDDFLGSLISTGLAFTPAGPAMKTFETLNKAKNLGLGGLVGGAGGGVPNIERVLKRTDLNVTQDDIQLITSIKILSLEDTVKVLALQDKKKADEAFNEEEKKEKEKGEEEKEKAGEAKEKEEKGEEQGEKGSQAANPEGKEKKEEGGEKEKAPAPSPKTESKAPKQVQDFVKWKEEELPKTESDDAARKLFSVAVSIRGVDYIYYTRYSEITKLLEILRQYTTGGLLNKAKRLVYGRRVNDIAVIIENFVGDTEENKFLEIRRDMDDKIEATVEASGAAEETKGPSEEGAEEENAPFLVKKNQFEMLVSLFFYGKTTFYKTETKQAS